MQEVLCLNKARRWLRGLEVTKHLALRGTVASGWRIDDTRTGETLTCISIQGNAIDAARSVAPYIDTMPPDLTCYLREAWGTSPEPYKPAPAHNGRVQCPHCGEEHETDNPVSKLAAAEERQDCTDAVFAYLADAAAFALKGEPEQVRLWLEEALPLLREYL